MNSMTRLIAVWVLTLSTSAVAPASEPHHQSSYSWQNVEIVGGGYVPGIIFNASEPGLVYARTDIGGAYRFDTSDQRWIPLLDDLGWDEWNLTGVDSLATDPVDPDRVYVLAGTYTNDWAGTNGAVLRSRNRGRTWRRTDLPFKSGGNMPGRNMGERLSIDPNDNSVLYLGTRSGNGLWRSTDFGRHWSQVTSFPAVGTYAPDPSDPSGYSSDPLGIVWIVFDPTSAAGGGPSREIYVGVADLGTSVYHSTDAGETWAALAGQPIEPAFMPHHGVLASTGVLYITYNNNGGPYDGSMGDVWKYDTNTAAWTRISPDPSTSTNDWFGYGGLAVDAQHPDTIMVSALNQWWPDSNIWRSTDAGATWTAIWDWGPWPERILRYDHDITGAPWLTFGATPGLPEVSPKLGWMMGDLEIDPFDSDRMLYGTGATIYGSDDLTNWDAGGQITISVKAQGLEETAVLDLISPPEGAPLLSGLGDIGGFRHDDLSIVPELMYTDPFMGNVGSLDFAELVPSVIFRSGSSSSAGFSLDGGVSWQATAGAPPGASQGTIAVAADASAVVWSSGAGVFSSTDNGTTWLAAAGVPAGAVVESDRVAPGTFYAFAGGAFYVSVDGGVTFAATPALGLPAASVRFKAVPGFAGHVWLAGGSDDEADVYGLWFSHDAGASFTKKWRIDAADTIGFGKAAPGRDYPTLYTSAKIRGQRGIYRSVDGGRRWKRINDSQHEYAWTGGAITGDPRVFGRVYISTNGRGVIYGEPRVPHGGHGGHHHLRHHHH